MTLSLRTYAATSPKLSLATPLCWTRSSGEIQTNRSNSSFNLIVGSCSRRTTKGRTLISGLRVDLKGAIAPRKRQRSRRLMLVSSNVSLITVCFRFWSLGSRFPPGNAICPDQGSVGLSTLLTKKILVSRSTNFNSKATAASASCAREIGFSLLDSFSMVQTGFNFRQLRAFAETVGLLFQNYSCVDCFCSFLVYHYGVQI